VPLLVVLEHCNTHTCDMRVSNNGDACG
jgi:hypothetical protein